jgi:hypothetical protein
MLYTAHSRTYSWEYVETVRCNSHRQETVVFVSTRLSDCYHHQIKDDCMGEICGTFEGKDKCIDGFGGKT